MVLVNFLLLILGITSQETRGLVGKVNKTQMINYLVWLTPIRQSDYLLILN